MFCRVLDWGGMWGQAIQKQRNATGFGSGGGVAMQGRGDSMQAGPDITVRGNEAVDGCGGEKGQPQATWD